LERHEEVERRADLRAGLLASLLYNPHRRKGARPMGPADFFPARAKQPVRARPRRVRRSTE
jgi:hypothetical protein